MIGPVYGNHIVANATLLQTKSPDEPLRRQRDPLDFFLVNGFGWIAPVIGRSSFNFDKHEGFKIDHDQVDLAEFIRVPSVDRHPATAQKKTLGFAFTAIAERLLGRN